MTKALLKLSAPGPPVLILWHTQCRREVRWGAWPVSYAPSYGAAREIELSTSPLPRVYLSI